MVVTQPEDQEYEAEEVTGTMMLRELVGESAELFERVA